MQFVAASQQSLDPLRALGADICMLHSAVMAFVPYHAPLDVCAHMFLFQLLSHHTPCTGDHSG